MITVVLGASPNPRRYSYKAVEVLLEAKHTVIPVGVKKGGILGLAIQGEYPKDIKIDTIAMYLGVENQKKYYDLILENPPKRIIFNPGTYNPEFQQILIKKGIEVVNDCLLIMMSKEIYSI
ncbi:MAG: CoA-binding protein [Bacteroidales bacterium]|jgi:predicted CoA-binding protein|nr:CoA-binding protein [Bacteroidales bacterium]MCK9498965.1 CoA-binding protein [Bacteroidales bacterium]MDY0313844.1 CoA-binding protein [Bacteroidales bacterium]NLB86172.1 CoA-binding protein [Bacteroidales bacterium]